MAKTPKFKVGDKVATILEPKIIFELVWYKEGDATCAIQNSRLRLIVKVHSLIRVEEQYDDTSSYGDEESDGEEYNQEDKSSTEEYNDDDYDY
jgi:hypothetical protein